ncbi:MAG: hypothetical protein ACLR0N_09435 [Bilophila wadsworthia]
MRGPEGFGKERVVGGGGVPRRVGSDDLYFAAADRLPERLAVCLLAQGRGYLGRLPQRKLAVVQRQIMGQVSAKSVGTVPHFLNSLMASRDSLQVTCGR